MGNRHLTHRVGPLAGSDCIRSAPVTKPRAGASARGAGSGKCLRVYQPQQGIGYDRRASQDMWNPAKPAELSASLEQQPGRRIVRACASESKA